MFYYPEAFFPKLILFYFNLDIYFVGRQPEGCIWIISVSKPSSEKEERSRYFIVYSVYCMFQNVTFQPLYLNENLDIIHNFGIFIFWQNIKWESQTCDL